MWLAAMIEFTHAIDKDISDELPHLGWDHIIIEFTPTLV